MTEILLIAGIIATIWIVIGLANLFMKLSNGSAWGLCAFLTCLVVIGAIWFHFLVKSFE